MNERAFRCLAFSLLAFALLAVVAGPAAAQEQPRVSPRAMAEFRTIAPPQAACQLCAKAFEKCSTACFGLAEKGGMGACLTACDNAAISCSCDQTVSLRSEDLVDFKWPALTKAACHGNVSCQPYYPSCASWTTYSPCDSPYCGTGLRCGECTYDPDIGREFCGPGPAWKEPQERFRVCFDAYGNSCTEWQKIIVSTCDCY